ncbi:MAG: peptide deformylase [Actinomycetota bacterium]|nr:peptide deformylase [Actinomycetota bacterium]
MAVLPVRTFGDPVLRQRAGEVERVDDLHVRLIEDMIETMRAAPGVGLAGPQVGVLDRVFVYEVEEEKGALLNPVITWTSPEKVEEEEGCLSLPGLLYPVERHLAVRVEGLDQSGAPVVKGAEGLLARVFQHEIDHLDGVLFVDRLPAGLRKKAMRELTDLSLGLPQTTSARSIAASEEIL